MVRKDKEKWLEKQLLYSMRTQIAFKVIAFIFAF